MEDKAGLSKRLIPCVFVLLIPISTFGMWTLLIPPEGGLLPELAPYLLPGMERKEAHLNRVRFFTQQIGWIVGEFGSLFVTRDGGRSWQARETGTSVTLM